jgi:hypothetical protein
MGGSTDGRRDERRVKLVLLDNEAVTALLDPAHPKHRRVVAHLQAVVGRRRKAVAERVLVATAVRVEAGWDRTQPGAAAINRLRIDDAALDSAMANVAAGIVQQTSVSVADAHTGSVARSVSGADVVVLTSDPDDMRRVAAPVPIRAILI